MVNKSRVFALAVLLASAAAAGSLVAGEPAVNATAGAHAAAVRASEPLDGAAPICPYGAALFAGPTGTNEPTIILFDYDGRRDNDVSFVPERLPTTVPFVFRSPLFITGSLRLDETCRFVHAGGNDVVVALIDVVDRTYRYVERSTAPLGRFTTIDGTVRTVAVGSTTEVRHAQTGALLRSFPRPAGAEVEALSADGRSIAYMAGRTVSVYEVETRGGSPALQRYLPRLRGGWTDVVFSPSGKRIAVAHDTSVGPPRDRTAADGMSLIDVRTGETRTHPLPPLANWSFRFTSDERLLTCGLAYYEVLWDGGVRELGALDADSVGIASTADQATCNAL